MTYSNQFKKVVAVATKMAAMDCSELVLVEHLFLAVAYTDSAVTEIFRVDLAAVVSELYPNIDDENTPENYTGSLPKRFDATSKAVLRSTVEDALRDNHNVTVDCLWNHLHDHLSRIWLRVSERLENGRG